MNRSPFESDGKLDISGEELSGDIPSPQVPYKLFEELIALPPPIIDILSIPVMNLGDLEVVLNRLYEYSIMLNTALEEVYPVASTYQAKLKGVISEIRETIKELKVLRNEVKVMTELTDDLVKMVNELVVRIVELSDKTVIALDDIRVSLEEDLKRRIQLNPYLYLTARYLKASLKIGRYLEIGLKNFDTAVDVAILYDQEVSELSLILRPYRNEEIVNLLNDLQVAFSGCKLCLKRFRELIDRMRAKEKLEPDDIDRVYKDCAESWKLFAVALKDAENIMRALSPMRTSLFRKLDLALAGRLTGFEPLDNLIPVLWERLSMFLDETSEAIKALERESLILDVNQIKPLEEELSVISEEIDSLRDEVSNLYRLEDYHTLRSRVADLESAILELLAELESLRGLEEAGRAELPEEVRSILITYEKVLNSVLPLRALSAKIANLNILALYTAVLIESLSILRKSLFRSEFWELQKACITLYQLTAELNELLLNAEEGLDIDSEEFRERFAKLLRSISNILRSEKELNEELRKVSQNDDPFRKRCYKCGELIAVNLNQCPSCRAIFPDNLFEDRPFLRFIPPQELYPFALLIEMYWQGKIPEELLIQKLENVSQALNSDPNLPEDVLKLWNEFKVKLLRGSDEVFSLWQRFLQESRKLCTEET